MQGISIFLLLFLVSSLAPLSVAEKSLKHDSYYNLEELMDYSTGEDLMSMNRNERKTNSRYQLVSTVYITIAVVGLLANCTVFFVIFCGDEISKTVTAIYVAHLAFADSIFLIALLFFAKQQIDHEWKFGKVACIICQTIKLLNYYAGIFFLTAMSVDRYIAVAYGAKASKLRSKIRTMVSCAIVWLASLAMSLPAILFSDTNNIANDSLCILMYPGFQNLNASDFELEFSKGFFPANMTEDYKDEISGFLTFNQYKSLTDVEDHELYEDYPNDSLSDGNNDTKPWICKRENEPTAYYVMEITKFVLGFVIPFLVITVCYGLILKRLRVSEKRLANGAGKRTHNMRKRVTRMVSALVICFVVCWLPHHIFTLAQFKGFNLTQSVCFGIEIFVAVFGYANSAFNPILYTFLGHDFHGRLAGSYAKARRRLGWVAVPVSKPPAKSQQQSHKNRCSLKRMTTPGFHEPKESEKLTTCRVENDATNITENQGMLGGKSETIAETKLL